MVEKEPVTARIVCFGELLLRLTAPERELLLQSPRLDVYYGGAEANVAASLAVLGHDSAVVSTLPDNAIGHACVGELRRLGVDTRGIGTREGRIGLYFLAMGALHRPSEILYDRADSAFARAPADAYDWPALLDGAHWLHLSGITLAVGANATGAAHAAVRAARERGLRVSFDCNYRSKVWGSRAGEAPALLRELAGEADLLFANEHDIALMLGLRSSREQSIERFSAAAAAAFATWPRLRYMAATERRHDSVDHQQLAGLLASRNGTHRTRSHTLNGIVDRIGAGDAFAAGVLHGLLRGMDEARTLDLAVASACLKHSLVGDVNRLREADMLAFLADEGLDVRR